MADVPAGWNGAPADARAGLALRKRIKLNRLHLDVRARGANFMRVVEYNVAVLRAPRSTTTSRSLSKMQGEEA
jgi:hypothetical protein